MKKITEIYECVLKVRTKDIFSITNDLSNIGFKYSGIFDLDNYLSIEPISAEIVSVQQSKGSHVIKLLCKIEHSLSSTNSKEVLKMLSEYNEVCSNTEHKIINITFEKK